MSGIECALVTISYNTQESVAYSEGYLGVKRVNVCP
jgi:hypothetical protein